MRFSLQVPAFLLASLLVIVSSQENDCQMQRGTICDMDIDSVIDIESEETDNPTKASMDLYSCRNSCWKQDGCQNYTFFQHEQKFGKMTLKCIMFKTCERQSFCATCMSGPSQCQDNSGIDSGFWNPLSSSTSTPDADTNNDVEIVSESPLITTSRRSLDVELLIKVDTVEANRQPKQLEDESEEDAEEIDVDASEETEDSDEEDEEDEEYEEYEEDEEEQDDEDEDEDEYDDYEDPFNVDDGLLEDENDIEDFPEYEDEEQEAEEEDANENPDEDAETIDNGVEEPSYFHCMFGGYGPFGPINSIGHIGRIPFPLFSPIPSTFPLGFSGSFSSMVRGTLYFCSPGAVVRRQARFFQGFFPFQPQPQTASLESGKCLVYNPALGLWSPSGGEMNTYRAGGSITRMGKFMVASGGRRFPRSLNSIEVMSTRRPGRWRVLSKFTLPNATHDHCTVSLNKTALFMAGGVNQESQAYIMDLKAKTKEPVQPMKQPRSQVSFKLWTKNVDAKYQLQLFPALLHEGKNKWQRRSYRCWWQIRCQPSTFIIGVLRLGIQEMV